MTAKIRTPATGPGWLPDYNRNVERAINDLDFEARIAAIEETLMSLDSSVALMAEYLANLSEASDEMAAQGRATVHLLSQTVALLRGRSDPDLGEEVFDLIEEFRKEGD